MEIKEIRDLEFKFNDFVIYANQKGFSISGKVKVSEDGTLKHIFNVQDD